MTALEQRIAQALSAFRRSEGFSLTEDQFISLIDQMALACGDILGDHNCHYDQFMDAAWDEVPCAP